jgi:hypothetical protein
MPRFRIADLVVLVALCALVLATLQYGPPSLTALFLALTSIATVGAWRGRRSRALWLGVAVFGWTYAVVGLRLGDLPGRPLEDRLIAGFAGSLISGLGSSWFGRRGDPSAPPTGP